LAVILFAPFIVIVTVSGVSGASGLTTGSPVQLKKPQFGTAAVAVQETTTAGLELYQLPEVGATDPPVVLKVAVISSIQAYI
jgi:membrane-associated protease RseP (regulator of RpoE activity)